MTHEEAFITSAGVSPESYLPGIKQEEFLSAVLPYLMLAIREIDADPLLDILHPLLTLASIMFNAGTEYGKANGNREEILQ